MSILMQNLKLFLRLSNCASVGEKSFDNYQDARFVGENKRRSSFGNQENDRIHFLEAINVHIKNKNEIRDTAER
jgi:hypothetical protein